MNVSDADELSDVRRTYSVEEAAAILGISRTTAYESVKSKELPALRFRGRIVVPAAALESLLTTPVPR
jgi:excisionase family DNA binding protein